MVLGFELVFLASAAIDLFIDAKVTLAAPLPWASARRSEILPQQATQEHAEAPLNRP